MSDRFYSTQFFSTEHNQTIVAIHDNVADQCVFLASNFEIKKGLCAGNATPEELSEFGFKNIKACAQ